MGCYCECDYGEETVTFYHDEIRVARKHHHCCECRKPISPGEEYQKVSGVDGGRFFHFKTCSPCLEIRTTLCGDCWTLGNLYEDIAELEIGDLEKLSPAARNKLGEVWGCT